MKKHHLWRSIIIINKSQLPHHLALNNPTRGVMLLQSINESLKDIQTKYKRTMYAIP